MLTVITLLTILVILATGYSPSGNFTFISIITFIIASVCDGRILNSLEEWVKRK